MSSEATPISPARFAEALQELPSSALALKVLELRNSIAHLDYSNAELKPFAEGQAPAPNSQPDQDCIDAIKENEIVIERMQERIELVKVEVENRGLNWDEFKGTADKQEQKKPSDGDDAPLTNGVNGSSHAPSAQNGGHPAWRDGTFQTGTLPAGLSDEELLRRLQERMPELQEPEDEQDADGGLHL